MNAAAPLDPAIAALADPTAETLQQLKPGSRLFALCLLRIGDDAQRRGITVVVDPAVQAAAVRRSTHSTGVTTSSRKAVDPMDYYRAQADTLGIRR